MGWFVRIAQNGERRCFLSLLCRASEQLAWEQRLTRRREAAVVIFVLALCSGTHVLGADRCMACCAAR